MQTASIRLAGAAAVSIVFDLFVAERVVDCAVVHSPPTCRRSTTCRYGSAS